jgi:hypothetical protein
MTVLSGWRRLGVAAVLLALMPVQAWAGALTITASGDLPGFASADAPKYLAAQMAQSGVSGWTFVAAQDGAATAPDRVEWKLTQQPYGGGGMRQFIPIPAVQRMFGTRYVVTAELRVYLGGQYQTVTTGQATVHGGAQDEDLAKFVGTMTQNLLGETGALRSLAKPAPTP